MQRIDGSSVGALNGFAIINNNIEKLKDIWFNITKIQDLFTSWSDSYIFQNICLIIMDFIRWFIFNSKLRDMRKLQN